MHIRASRRRYERTCVQIPANSLADASGGGFGMRAMWKLDGGAGGGGDRSSNVSHVPSRPRRARLFLPVFLSAVLKHFQLSSRS